MKRLFTLRQIVCLWLRSNWGWEEDSLWSVAADYGVPVSTINDLDGVGVQVVLRRLIETGGVGQVGAFFLRLVEQDENELFDLERLDEDIPNDVLSCFGIQKSELDRVFEGDPNLVVLEPELTDEPQIMEGIYI